MDLDGPSDWRKRPASAGVEGLGRQARWKADLQGLQEGLAKMGLPGLGGAPSPWPPPPIAPASIIQLLEKAAKTAGADLRQRLRDGEIRDEDRAVSAVLEPFHRTLRSALIGLKPAGNATLSYMGKTAEHAMGADFAICVTRTVKGVSREKGVLVQAKRLGRGRSSLTRSQLTDLEEQAMKLDDLSNSSLVWVIGENTDHVVSAATALRADNSVITSGEVPLAHSIRGLLDCSGGDSRLGPATVEILGGMGYVGWQLRLKLPPRADGPSGPG